MILLQTTTVETTTGEVVRLDPGQFEQFGQLLSFSTGLLAFLVMLVGGLLIIEIHRG